MNNTPTLSQLRSLLQTNVLDLQNLYDDHSALPSPSLTIWRGVPGGMITGEITFLELK